VIERVKDKLEEVKPGLPEGVEVVTTYDRSDLILRSIETLVHTLTEELIIVSLVILFFLRHLPSALIPIVTIPIAVVISFIPMQASGLTPNIMSLSGIAIAIGALVDAAIVVVEQTHKKLEHWEAAGRPGYHHRVIIDAVKEVGGPSFFSLLVIAVSFVPIFGLQARRGATSSRWPSTSTRPWRWRPSWPSPSTRRCGCSSCASNPSASARAGSPRS
jgi:Cu(I)/Ag(I) efflux system membrane protein CusA/SilA